MLLFTNMHAPPDATPRPHPPLVLAMPHQVKGIIYPPPDIRAIVDKTARFVAKNGKSFEERIQASEEGKSAKFNFMRPHDPYYAYYEFKIRDFEENGDAPKPVRKREGQAEGR